MPTRPRRWFEVEFGDQDLSSLFPGLARRPHRNKVAAIQARVKALIAGARVCEAIWNFDSERFRALFVEPMTKPVPRNP
jgi:hypothetical protein